MTGCWTSRKTSKSSELRVECVESVEKVDSVVVEHSDTLREVTTITVQLNDTGDTLKISTVTNRTTVRDHDRTQYRTESVEVRVDTVYVEKDSLEMKEIPHHPSTGTGTMRNEGGGLFGGGTTGRQGLIASLTRNLKWLFFVLLAIIALILLIRFKLFK